ncbi:PepSY domain-containing protein [Corynebacterium guaraldiae]|uniref:PepSY domain-containing protein n=1 Tax=Corynebacterium guaraldiae TaxID=3051103 RepID=UPI00259D28C6|nr:PepSY domain-containing protein [Corynebacterium guaraldiae]
MFVGPFILIAALTGCLYAVAPSLEKVVYHDVLTVPTVENPLSLEEQIQAAQHEHPDMPVTQVCRPRHRRIPRACWSPMKASTRACSAPSSSTPQPPRSSGTTPPTRA